MVFCGPIGPSPVQFWSFSSPETRLLNTSNNFIINKKKPGYFRSSTYIQGISSMGGVPDGHFSCSKYEKVGGKKGNKRLKE